MKFIIALLLSCASFALGQKCSCGVENTDTRIIGGTVVTENKYPWMVLLNVKQADGNWYRCGGSIINDRYVLSAAHCVENAVQVNVGIGANTHAEVTNIPAKTFRMHPMYDVELNHNDIAIVKLSQRLQFSKKVRPICLPSNGMRQQGPFTVAGWGITESGSTSNKLLETTVDEYEWDKCNREWNNQLISSQFCAALIGKDSCGGDSGGPLTQRWRGKNYVVGIVSYGVTNCGSARTAVYTKVSDFADWVLSQTSDGNFCSS